MVYVGKEGMCDETCSETELISWVKTVSDVELLWSRCSWILTRQFEYDSLLSYAIKCKSIELVEYLAKVTPDVNRQSDSYGMCSGGETSMDVAIECFNDEAVRILLVNKANPNLLSSVQVLQHTGAPYLIKAAMLLRQTSQKLKVKAIVSMVKHLVEAKADINATYTFSESNESFTVLDVAVSNQCVPLTKYLLSKGGKMGLGLHAIKKMHYSTVFKPKLLSLLQSHGID